jgi:proteic killer suppression protein
MEIIFNTNKLHSLCTNERECQKHYPDKIVYRKIYQRLLELKAATNLEEICLLRSARCHRLTGKRKDQFAVSLTGNLRLIFIPIADHSSQDENGVLILSRVDSVKIIEIVDYH